MSMGWLLASVIASMLACLIASATLMMTWWLAMEGARVFDSSIEVGSWRYVPGPYWDMVGVVVAVASLASIVFTFLVRRRSLRWWFASQVVVSAALLSVELHPSLFLQIMAAVCALIATLPEPQRGGVR